VKSVAILLVKLDYKFFQEQLFVWSVNKKRNDAEFKSAKMVSGNRSSRFCIGLFK